MIFSIVSSSAISETIEVQQTKWLLVREEE